jgi:hypothetical protein
MPARHAACAVIPKLSLTSPAYRWTAKRPAIQPAGALLTAVPVDCLPTQGTAPAGKGRHLQDAGNRQRVHTSPGNQLAAPGTPAVIRSSAALDSPGMLMLLSPSSSAPWRHYGGHGAPPVRWRCPVW